MSILQSGLGKEKGEIFQNSIYKRKIRIFVSYAVLEIPRLSVFPKFGKNEKLSLSSLHLRRTSEFYW